ncbi:hypothetical protein FD754_009086, partial [Muntiacus muntjak]
AQWLPKTPAKSMVALKTPIKVELVAGKTYKWCVLSPLKLKAQETCMVARCTCKATQKPPYCDGTHKSEQVQKAELGSPL